MKILFIQDSLGTGGAERSNAYLWQHLRSEGVDLKIVVLTHYNHWSEHEILDQGYPVVFLKKDNFLGHSRQIAAIIKDYKPTLVHSVLFNSNIRTRLAKVFTPFYHVESLVNCTYDPIRFTDPRVNKAGLFLAKFVDYLTINRCVDHSVAITKEVASHYQQQLRLSPAKLSVILRGRSENEHLPDRTKLREVVNKEIGISPEKVLFIHVGRQEFQKGHVYLLQSLQKIYEENRQDWNKMSVLLCGREGNATADIEGFLVMHPHLKENVHLLGNRDDVPKLLAASDVFVFPSLYEGLGGSLIEAQAAALPVVCSDIAVLHEVVNKGENALMFPVKDIEAMAEQLRKLIHDAPLRRRMSEESLKNYQEKFRLEKINKDTLHFYSNMGKGKGDAVKPPIL